MRLFKLNKNVTINNAHIFLTLKFFTNTVQERNYLTYKPESKWTEPVWFLTQICIDIFSRTSNWTIPKFLGCYVFPCVIFWRLFFCLTLLWNKTAWSISRSQQSLNYSGNVQSLRVTECSLACSQNPTTVLYPLSNESSPCLPMILHQDRFKLTFLFWKQQQKYAYEITLLRIPLTTSELNWTLWNCSYYI
jgi:hypothetical protein